MSIHSIPTHWLTVEDAEDRRPIPTIVKMCLLLAIKDRARELRFEPQESSYRVSYQVAEQRYDMLPFSSELARPVVQVFKVMADLDICNSRSPQENRMRLCLDDGEAELLVSIDPSPHGETVNVNIATNTIAPEAAIRLLTTFVERPKPPL